MKIDPSAGRSPPPWTRGPGFFDVGVVRSAPESYRDRYRRTASVRSSRVRSVLPGWRPVLGSRASFLARRRSHPFSSGLTLLDSVSRRSCRPPAPPPSSFSSSAAPASPRRRRRSGGKSERPGQFERRSHRLHHVPEAVLVRCLSEWRVRARNPAAADTRCPRIEGPRHAMDASIRSAAES